MKEGLKIAVVLVGYVVVSAMFDLLRAERARLVDRKRQRAVDDALAESLREGWSLNRDPGFALLN